MADLIYNPGQCYMSFPFFRRYAKRWFNRGFFLHDCAYRGAVRWQVHKKIKADWELIMWIARRANSLYSAGEFSLFDLVLAWLFAGAVFAGVATGGWIGWFKLKRFFQWKRKG